MQYGPNLRALACYLVVFQHVPAERAALLIADVTGRGSRPRRPQKRVAGRIMSQIPCWHAARDLRILTALLAAGTPLPGSQGPAEVVRESPAGDVVRVHHDMRASRTWRRVEDPIVGHLVGIDLLRSEWHGGVAIPYGIRSRP
jgi:hypothetical protein